MRYLQKVLMSAGMLVVAISFTSPAFAEMGQGACRGGKEGNEPTTAQIKILRDSATALQASNPDLAKGLNDLADKKAETMKKRQEWSEKHDTKIKLLKDSSAALQATNPALAQELQRMSEKKPMENEEAGEMMEPRK